VRTQGVYLSGGEPVMRMSTSLLALCCQSEPGRKVKNLSESRSSDSLITFNRVIFAEEGLMQISVRRKRVCVASGRDHPSCLQSATSPTNTC
jgi:hypothetical protein